MPGLTEINLPAVNADFDPYVFVRSIYLQQRNKLSPKTKRGLYPFPKTKAIKAPNISHGH
ncbi:VacJ family lipoprotein [Candidatus Coxiella mudrowiae]|uniref:VacJ family lipoprotein n=1 Tax=Candidatus Coxiella mudrowiae TaxID=2054173 RepID=UPI001C129E4C|nr:VacJ family lipoprotein [Candidatus Coxiella mudrowiae]